MMDGRDEDAVRVLSPEEQKKVQALFEDCRWLVDPTYTQFLIAADVSLDSVYKRLADEQFEITIGAFNIPWGVGPRVTAWQPYPLALYPSALDSITLKS